MRVLLVAPFAPWPADSGGAQRSYAVLEGLAREHEVTLTCALPPVAPGKSEADARRECEHALAAHVREIRWAPAPNAEPPIEPSRLRVIRGLAALWDMATNTVPHAYRERYTAWAAMVGALAPQFDAIVVRCIMMSPVAASVDPERVVLDADDLHYMVLAQRAERETGLTRLATRLESRRCERYERNLFRQMCRVLVSNLEDQRRLGLSTVEVLPNGVTLLPPPPVTREAKSLVFVGHCGWRPNIEGLRWFFDEVWEPLRAAVPDVRLTVVGRDAHPDMCGSRALRGVSFAADVPEVASWFARASASVVPLWEGSGTRIKIVESLGYGTPVVSTPIGAAGLETDFGSADGLYLVDSSRAMLTQLVAVLEHGQPALAAAGTGQEKVRAAWTWSALTDSFSKRLRAWLQPPA